MLASFQLTGTQAESADMMCSTALVPEWACDGLQRLRRELNRIRSEQRGMSAAIAVDPASFWTEESTVRSMVTAIKQIAVPVSGRERPLYVVGRKQAVYLANARRPESALVLEQPEGGKAWLWLMLAFVALFGLLSGW